MKVLTDIEAVSLQCSLFCATISSISERVNTLLSWASNSLEMSVKDISILLISSAIEASYSTREAPQHEHAIYILHARAAEPPWCLRPRFCGRVPIFKLYIYTTASRSKASHFA